MIAIIWAIAATLSVVDVSHYQKGQCIIKQVKASKKKKKKKTHDMD